MLCSAGALHTSARVYTNEVRSAREVIATPPIRARAIDGPALCARHGGCALHLQCHGVAGCKKVRYDILDANYDTLSGERMIQDV